MYYSIKKEQSLPISDALLGALRAIIVKKGQVLNYPGLIVIKTFPKSKRKEIGNLLADYQGGNVIALKDNAIGIVPIC
jgi:hypothetical protein